MLKCGNKCLLRESLWKCLNSYSSPCNPEKEPIKSRCCVSCLSRNLESSSENQGAQLRHISGELWSGLVHKTWVAVLDRSGQVGFWNRRQWDCHCNYFPAEIAQLAVEFQALWRQVCRTGSAVLRRESHCLSSQHFSCGRRLVAVSLWRSSFIWGGLQMVHGLSFNLLCSVYQSWFFRTVYFR